MTRAALTRLTAVALGLVLVSSAAFIAVRHVFAPTTFTAIFANANAIYPGDEVRIAGVKVGTITAIEPDATQAIFTLQVDHGIRVSSDAKAVVVAQNLVSARFVQLTPGGSSGPAMVDGAVIPREHTAVPVEWDEVKEQLNRLASDLGPDWRCRDQFGWPLHRHAQQTRWTAMAKNSDRHSSSCPESAGSSPTAAGTSPKSSAICRLS